MLEAIPRYLDILVNLSVEPPVLLMLSLVGVKGRRMLGRDSLSYGDPIDRDALIIPEVLVDDFKANPSDVMKPAFDALWNASGWSASPHYDKDGKWKSE